MKKWWTGLLFTVLVAGNGWLLFQNYQIKHATLIPCEIKAIAQRDQQLFFDLSTYQTVDFEEVDLTYNLSLEEARTYQDLLQIGNKVILVMHPDTLILETYPGQLRGKLLDVRQ